MSIQDLFQRIKDRFDSGGDVEKAVAEGIVNVDNVDEFVDGIHFERSQMYGEEAPSRQDWYDYVYHHLEGDMRNT
jgi:hypothetical protein